MIKTYGDRQPGLGTSAIVGALTLAKTGTTARTATFPDAAITVAGSASALTSGRVPFVTTGGLLTDSANFLFGSGTGILTIGTAAQAFNSRIDINSASGFNRGILMQTGGLSRWFVFADTSTESGSDAGSTFILRAYTDAGASIDSPISIIRAAGGAITLARPVTCTGVVTVPNGTAASPGIRLTSEASGLYRVSATSLGFAVAGTAAASLTSAGALSAASLTVTGGASAAATVYKSATFGLAVQLATGSSYDGGFLKPDASAFLWYIPTGTGNVVFPSGSIVVGTTALAGSERARFTGGTMGTPGATDVLIAAGAISCGSTLSATGLRATTGFHEGPINGRIAFNAYYSAGWKYRSNGYASALTDNAASGVVLQVAPTGLADAAISWQAVFTGTPTTLGFASAIVSTFNNTTDATTTSDGSVRLSGGLSVASGKSIVAGAKILSVGATSGIGYATGAGGTVTQATSRTTGVTLNTVTGAITLVSAAGSATWQTFTVTNSAVAATDTVIVDQVSGTDLNMIAVTNIAAGSFKISFATTGGTTTEQPVFRFTVIKSVSA